MPFAPALLRSAFISLSLAACSAPLSAQETTASAGLLPCEDLPTGALTDQELVNLVPDGSPGRVRIAWRTESQEECYGFNIYRAGEEGGKFAKINKGIIPGEGSTNIPKTYCYEDRSVERGKTYFYYIEEISNQGVAVKLEDTMGADGKGTRAKVKTVEEERVWLRKKALGDDAATTAPAAKVSAPKGAAPAGVLRAAPAPPAGPAEKNPLE